MSDPSIVVTLQDGSTITWHPGEETPFAVETIESFLGPGEVSYG
jgi:hypothetical protein